jgi:hypothetical protein
MVQLLTVASLLPLVGAVSSHQASSAKRVAIIGPQNPSNLPSGMGS